MTNAMLDTSLMDNLCLWWPYLAPVGCKLARLSALVVLCVTEVPSAGMPRSGRAPCAGPCTFAEPELNRREISQLAHRLLDHRQNAIEIVSAIDEINRSLISHPRAEQRQGAEVFADAGQVRHDRLHVNDGMVLANMTWALTESATLKQPC